MNNNVFISCAVTGSGDTASKHPDLPKTPEQIAKSAIEAAKAGAAIAHIHVREEDGTPSRRLELYKEVVDRIRSSETDVILNLTTGMGGDLDNDLRKAAKKLQEIKVKPEIEAFDLGNMWFGSQLYKEGLLDDPPMFQMCLGIPWGAPATPLAMQAMKDIMPKEGVWSGFAISKNEMPFVAQTVVMGGNPRVGLEDNLYLSKGKLATNAQLVEKAIRIVTDLGASIMTAEETRTKLKLVKHK